MSRQPSDFPPAMPFSLLRNRAFQHAWRFAILWMSSFAWLAEAADVTVTVQAKTTPTASYTNYATQLVQGLQGYAPGTVAASPYGGRLDRRVAAAGFFRTVKINGRWWLVDPQGYLCIDRAVVATAPGGGPNQQAGFAKQFTGTTDWVNKTTSLLLGFGFNGTGAWSSDSSLGSVPRRVSYTPNWDFMTTYGASRVTAGSGHVTYPQNTIFVFDPAWPAFCDSRAQAKLAASATDPWLIGHFYDNELPLTPQMIYRYLLLPTTDPGYLAAYNFLVSRHGSSATSADLTTTDWQDFDRIVLENYMAPITAAIRKYDPNHLALGPRLNATVGALDVIGKYADIISFNTYNRWSPGSFASTLSASTLGKPMMVTEFYTKGMDVANSTTGLTNASGAGWCVPTQADRGKFYQNFCLDLLKSRVCVGWHWFKYQDNDPDDLTTDASNRTSNKGIVNDAYNIYPDLTGLMTELNGQVYTLADLYDSRIPSVSFAAPLDGDVLPAGTNLAITVNAASSASTINNVQLFCNGVLVRQESIAPYNWDQAHADTPLLNLAPGIYTLRALATDDTGLTAEQTITVTVGPVQPTTVVDLPVTADGYVRDGTYATTNFGTSTSLALKKSTSTGYQREVYLRFSLAGVDPLSVQKAELLLTPFDTVAPSYSGDISAVADSSWNEAAITWNSHPTAGSVVGGWASLGAGAAVSADITSAAKAAAGLPMSLRLRSASQDSDAVISFFSKEGDATQAPRLRITRTAQSPVVAFTSPLAGFSNQEGQGLSVAVSAADTNAGGGIANVKLYLDGVLVRIVTAAPYIWSASQDAALTHATLGNHTLRAVATNVYGLSAEASVSFTTGFNLPPPFALADLGSVAQPGYVNAPAASFLVRASGADISGTADAGAFVQESVAGDAVIVARVASVQNTSGWAKSGLMIRDGLAASAVNAAVFVTPSNGVTFQTRTATGGASTSATTAGPAAPVWLRLNRQGTTITASYSPNGTAWIAWPAVNLSMGATTQIGLAATAHDNTQVSQSVLDNVTVAAPSTFTGWQLLHFSAADLLNPAVTGPNADPDGDGLSNLAEYVAGLDPLKPDAVSGMLTVGKVAGVVKILFRERKVLDGLARHFMQSADLQTWTETAPANLQTTQDFGEASGWEASFSTDAPRAFYRLEYR